jgi:hypothetical protein
MLTFYCNWMSMHMFIDVYRACVPEDGRHSTQAMVSLCHPRLGGNEN